MKKILVPTDFSEDAERATLAALEIASRANAELYFLHLHPAPASVTCMPASGSTGHQSDGCGPARAKLDSLVRRSDCRKVNAKQVLVMDERQEQLEKHAKAFSIDLVVIGSNNTQRMKGIFLGSGASHLIRHSTIPVLVIKEKPFLVNVRNIVFTPAVKGCLEQSLQFVNRLARLWYATIHLLFIKTHSNFRKVEEAVKIAEHHISTLTVPYRLSVCNSSSEESGIQKYSREINADIIAIEEQPSWGFLNVISSSTCKNVINQGTTPVLVITSKHK